MRQGRLQRHLCAMQHGAFQQFQRDGRLFSDALRELDALLKQLHARHRAIDQPHRDRLAGTEKITCKHQEFCLA